jgi:hypothetical protein
LGILLLPLKVFLPLTCILFGIVTTLFFTLTCSIKVKDFRFFLWLIPALIFIFIFRLTPSIHLMGGQDQGTYPSMASQYLQSGTLYAVDTFRETLNPEQKEIYDKDGNYIMPSIHKWDRPGNEYSMNFYPGFPVSLAIFGYLFGIINFPYIIILFSVLALINFYLIIFYLTKNKKLGLLGFVLLGINPVYVFFSNFSVNEVFAFFIVTSGIYFFQRYFDSTQNFINKALYILFSLMSIFIFCLTKLSFLIYIPLLGLLAILFIKSKKVFIEFSFFMLFSSLIAALSLFYYKLFLYPLYQKIFIETYVVLFNKYFNNVYVLALSLLIFAIFSCLVYFLWTKRLHLDLLRDILYRLVVTVFILIIVVRTGVVLNYIIFEHSYEIFQIKLLPLFAISNYVSVFALILFIFTIYYSFKNKTYQFLVLSTLYFMTVYLLRTKTVFTEYYQSRYFLSEIIPLIILICVLYFEKMQKTLRYIIFGLIISYYLFFSLFQINKIEGNNMTLYNVLLNTVDTEDLIIMFNKNIYEDIKAHDFNSDLFGPIKYFFNYKTLVLRDLSDLDNPELKSLLDSQTNIYYISNVSFDEKALEIPYIYTHLNQGSNCDDSKYYSIPLTDLAQLNITPFLNCNLLPLTSYERTRVLYFGQLK